MVPSYHIQKNRFSSLEKRELPSENLKVNNRDFVAWNLL